MKWNLLALDQVDNLKKLERVLLKNREIKSAKDFFVPLHPTELISQQIGINQTQLNQGKKRILSAIKNKEKILVFGDYDADGICATAILWTTLNHLGAKAFPFIPNREKHGYGISMAALNDILAEGKPDLIITVDNGIVAFEPLKFLKKEKIDVILTDHHQPEFKDESPIYPQADSIIHSTQLCGASVAWFLAYQLDPDFSLTNLDLAGVATIADQVPLVEANRSFAYHGILALKQTNRAGILALAEQASISTQEIDSSKINFVIAPRINAMGRLEDGLDALRLLCTKDQLKAKQLASLLQQTNDRRKDLTYDMVKDATSGAQGWEEDKIIIVHSSDYHEGVIGLIAGRLSEKYYKPAIAISVGQDSAKASARSVSGVNIVELIRQVQDDLLAVGGHPMAAGFGVEITKLDLVIDKLKQLAFEQINADLLEPTFEVECRLDNSLINLETLDLLVKFEPFGQGNRVPIFQFDELLLVDAKPIGKQQNHLKLTVKNEEQKFITCLGWGKIELLQAIMPGDKISILASMQVNQFNGRKTVQLVIEDLKKTPQN